MPFNQPKLCPNVPWNPNGITFEDSSTIGMYPLRMFVDSHNTVCVTTRTMHLIQVWSEGNINPTRTISGNSNDPLGLFVTINGDVYIDNSQISRVESNNKNNFSKSQKKRYSRYQTRFIRLNIGEIIYVRD